MRGSTCYYRFLPKLGVGECFQEGSINFFSFNYTNVGSLRIVEGRVEVCNSNGVYESVCDIGWDTVEAHLVCSYFFIDYGKLNYYNIINCTPL